MNEIIQIDITDGSETVNLATAKEWLRVTSEDDDAIITELITVARKRVERYAIISMVSKTIVYTAYLDRETYLPYAPINAITTVNLFDGQDSNGANVWESLTAIDYTLIGSKFKPNVQGTYQISYTTTASTDAGLKTDLKRVLLWMYENRGDDSDSMPRELMSNAKTLKNLSWV